MSTTARTTTTEALKNLGLTPEQMTTIVARIDAERAEAARNERARCKSMVEWYTSQESQPLPFPTYVSSLLSNDY